MVMPIDDASGPIIRKEKAARRTEPYVPESCAISEVEKHQTCVKISILITRSSVKKSNGALIAPSCASAPRGQD